MKLFYTKRSPYARKVRVVSLEKNIPLGLVDEDLMKKSPELLKTNPLGKIPALLLDDGQAICDSPVICEYLDSLKASPRMIPESGPEKFKVLHLQAIADGLMDICVAVFMEKLRHPQNANELFIKNQEDTMLRTLQYLENKTADLEKLHMGSIAVASAIGYMHFRMPNTVPSPSSDLGKWYAAFSERPSMQETKPVAN